MCPNLQFPVDLITLTEEILNEKPHFFCSELELLNPLTPGIHIH